MSLIAPGNILQSFDKKPLAYSRVTPVVCVRHRPFVSSTNDLVRWRESLRLPSLTPQDTKARLIQPVVLGNNPPEYDLTMKSHSPTDGRTVEKRTVRTGMEYLQALVDGCYAATGTTFDITMDGYFVRDTFVGCRDCDSQTISAELGI